VSERPHFRGPFDTIAKTYKKEGFRALYGGFGAVIVAGTPGTVLFLSGYAFCKEVLVKEDMMMKKPWQYTTFRKTLPH